MSARSWFIAEAVLIVLNLMGIATDSGSVWNGIVAVGLTVCAVRDFQQWRDQVAAAEVQS